MLTLSASWLGNENDLAYIPLWFCYDLLARSTFSRCNFTNLRFYWLIDFFLHLKYEFLHSCDIWVSYYCPNCLNKLGMKQCNSLNSILGNYLKQIYSRLLYFWFEGFKIACTDFDHILEKCGETIQGGYYSREDTN